MFDLGFSELFLVAIVALVVLGPERLPKAARFAGLWIRRARSQWQSVKSEFENELADEELGKSLRSTRDQLYDVRKQLKESGESLRSGFEPDREQDDSDYELDELGSASDPELKAMMEAGGKPEPEHEAGRNPPEPEEPGPDELSPDEPERRDPQPGEPGRREPGTPAPERREPPAPHNEPAPDQHLDESVGVEGDDGTAAPHDRSSKSARP